MNSGTPTKAKFILRYTNRGKKRNTNKGKGNKHFDDQVEMYIKQQTKRMTLKKEEVYKMAERVYWPGE